MLRPNPSELALLPKEFRSFQMLQDGRVAAGVFNHKGTKYWVKYDLSDLPNDFVSLDDLKSVLVDHVDAATVRKHELSGSAHVFHFTA